MIAFFYLISGATLKITDDVFDEDLYPGWVGLACGLVCTIIFAYFNFVDYWTRPIFVGISLGVLLAHKIDNRIFELGIALGVVLPLFTLAVTGQWAFDWFAWGTVSFFTWLDEYGNDWIDKRHSLGRANFLLEYRFGLKLGMFLLCLLYAMPWLYLLAFLLFDTGYALATYLGLKKMALAATEVSYGTT
jgi:hypothetical protein